MRNTRQPQLTSNSLRHATDSPGSYRATRRYTLRGHANHGRRVGVLGEQIFVPRGVPALESWFRNQEEGCILGCATHFPDGESEGGVRNASISFRVVEWSMNLKTDVKLLSSQEVGLVLQVPHKHLQIRLYMDGPSSS